MAELVNNGIVKMEWEKDKFLTRKSKGSGQTIFVAATHEYTNSEGKTVTVTFRPDLAFIWCDDYNEPTEKVWNTKEQFSWLKTNFGSGDGYPTEYDDNYYPLCEGDQLYSILISHFGLDDCIDDIRNRADDLSPYGEEHEIEM